MTQPPGASRGAPRTAFRDALRAAPRAAHLPTSLADLRTLAAGGAVLAVFERSAYLDLGGRIVALAAATLGRGPLSIGVEGFAAFQPLAVGQRVDLRDGALRIGARAVDLHAAHLWDPALPVLTPATASAGAARTDAEAAARDTAIAELLRGAPEGSITLLLDPPAAWPHSASRTLLHPLRGGLEAIADLLAGRADPGATAAAVRTEIAGRGGGLTPSGDDLLVGIMHALSVWPARVPAGGTDLRALLADAARPQTTRISAAYLEAAAHGWAAEPWHPLVRSVGTSPAAVRAAVRRLLRIGETSGADALTGFCWAWGRLEP